MTRTNALALVLSICPGLFIEGCHKKESSVPEKRSRTPIARAKVAQTTPLPRLTKEEVGAVLGQPVTSMEGTDSNPTYKTAVPLLEASIELDERRDAEDAMQAMAGARKATSFLGGTPEAVPDLGDEAFFGASPFLYVRKGSDVITIVPPRLQQVAQQQALARVQDSKTFEETVKAAQEMAAVSKGDPGQAGLQAGDPAQGALAAVKASSQRQGTEDEAKSRAMALALARKMLEKI